MPGRLEGGREVHGRCLSRLLDGAVLVVIRCTVAWRCSVVELRRGAVFYAGLALYGPGALAGAGAAPVSARRGRGLKLDLGGRAYARRGVGGNSKIGYLAWLARLAGWARVQIAQGQKAGRRARTLNAAQAGAFAGIPTSGARDAYYAKGDQKIGAEGVSGSGGKTGRPGDSL